MPKRPDHITHSSCPCVTLANRPGLLSHNGCKIVFLSLLEISLNLRLLTAKYLLGLRGQGLMLYDTFSLTGTMHRYRILLLIIV